MLSEGNQCCFGVPGMTKVMRRRDFDFDQEISLEIYIGNDLISKTTSLTGNQR